MEPEGRTWKTEVSSKATRVRDRRLGAWGRNHPALSTVKGLSFSWVFALTLGPLAPSEIALASGPKGPTDVPFEMYLGYTIVAKGSMGRLQKLNFIIDTGAVPSVVDQRVARKLSLKGTLDAVTVFTKDVRTEEVVVPTLELGPVHAESVRFLAQDLRFIENGLGLRIDAIIGLDVLGGHDFSIDFQSKRIAFGLPAGEPSKTTEPQVPFESGTGFAVVQIQIESQILRLMVDTGTSDLVLFAPRVHDRLPGARLAGVKTKTTMAGQERWPVLELPGARLGSADLATPRAVLMDGQATASVDLDGLLGVTSLGVRRITFDFGHNTIRWDPR